MRHATRPGLPALPYAHIAADERRAPLRDIEGATILYVPAGVMSWNLGPRLPLSERVPLVFRHRPDICIIAAALDDRRCWAQLRDTAPVVFTLAPDSTVDPLLMASILYFHKISSGRTWMPHQLLGTTLDVQVDGITVAVTIENPAPADEQPPDLLAPRPTVSPRGRHTPRPSWSDAVDQAATHTRDHPLAKPVTVGTFALWPLAVYATGIETGQYASTVTLEQLRYRLGEAWYAEDWPLAVSRCLRWLVAQLRHAGHSAVLPSPATRPLGGPLDALRIAADIALNHLHRLTSPRHDDPVVAAWTELTRSIVDISPADEGSDGLVWPTTYRWSDHAHTAWTVMVDRVDSLLIAHHGGLLPGTRVRIQAPHEPAMSGSGATTEMGTSGCAVIRAPLWTFDHDRRVVAGPPQRYFLTPPSRFDMSVPVDADRLVITPSGAD
ncbi:hypothetical protein NQK81_02430 [Amycolatopsis roodepoortensis]|uniref:hypothetical protein n=1 Tax=Amycolatopsis roodepoortensis TaxID=700274 RepID=UPI00214B6BC3|nr:hypothetical protein [Amycolatopsis roodepoortensis]UUV32331.1 hypothetical protein NQK81_02430 [Amycolatopsis roodepoortensis]